MCNHYNNPCTSPTKQFHRVNPGEIQTSPLSNVACIPRYSIKPLPLLTIPPHRWCVNRGVDHGVRTGSPSLSLCTRPRVLERISRTNVDLLQNTSSEQRCNRYETGIGIVSYRLYFGPDTGISIFFVGEKIHCLVFGFTNEKKKSSSFFFVFSSIRPDILCIK
jgi:hypothetical protein